MNQPTLEDLAKRVKRLERQNRILKSAGLVALLGIVAAVLLGQTKSNQVAKVVEAEKFVVMDQHGTVRAMLSADSSGAQLRLFDEDDQVRITLATCRDRTNLSFYNENGSVGVDLYTSTFFQGSGLNLNYIGEDYEGELYGWTMLAGMYDPSLLFLSPTNSSSFTMMMVSEHAPYMFLTGNEGIIWSAP
jgi:hypothetical protein